MRPAFLIGIVLVLVACGQGQDRPGGIAGFDAGPVPDAGAPADAGPEGGPDGGVDASSGAGARTIERDYGVEAPTCPAGRVPTWGDLRWTATVPEGARLRFRAGAASGADGLARADDVPIGEDPPATPPIYLDELLPEADRHLPYLRIWIELSWESADAQPALDSMDLDWVCLDAG